MSELISSRRAGLRWQLLASASAAAFTACGIHTAAADDTNRPTVWIELGGQLERETGFGEPFDPPFSSVASYASTYQHVSPIGSQDAAKFGNGFEGSVAIAPDGSDWTFSASVRYGRSNGKKVIHHQTYVYHKPKYLAEKGINNPTGGNFADITTNKRESHLTVDFEAGRDVGLGLPGSSSVLSAGVRFAQFNSSADFNLRARPDIHWYNGLTALPPGKYFPEAHFHSYAATGASARSFHGIGPLLSWNASAAVVKMSNEVHVGVDWGANASVLFGRQKTHTMHQTAMIYYTGFAGQGAQVASSYEHPHPVQNRNHFVAVPNIGGFAGASLQYANARVTIGYRADFFFGAIDGGIDTPKSESKSFYGPFATISFGLGG